MELRFVTRYAKRFRFRPMRVRPRPLYLTLTAVGVALAAIIYIVATPRSSPRTLRMLDIEMRASAGTFAQLFWAPDLHFVEQRSIRVAIRPQADRFQRLRFLLPARGVRWLRFDPTDAPGEILIADMRLLDSSGRVITTFDAEHLRPAQQIASITREGDLTRIVTTPTANDPFLFAAFGCVDRGRLVDTMAVVTPAGLLAVIVALLTLIGAGMAIVVRDALGRRGPTIAVSPSAGPWWVPALWLSSLFLTVFAVKLVLIRQFPLTVPFWDQWDAEARGLYVPYGECSLPWAQMFALHNEHRVFFTRVLALALEVVNAQWDPRLQQVVNAAIHALTAVLLATAFWAGSDRRWLDLIVMICAAAFALPFAWENTLMGFQSAFYFLLLFSILALWLTSVHRAGTGPWLLGWACAVCALFTAAGGMLVAVAIAGVTVVMLAQDRKEWKQSLVTLTAAGAVLGLGLVVASPALPHHEPLRAKTIGDFAEALGRNLAWPWIGQPQTAVLMWLPLCALVIRVAGARAKVRALERLVIGLGFWVVLQASAIAYGRGAGGPVPAARYQDFLSIGFVVNTMALLVLLVDRTHERTRARQLVVGGFIGWLVLAMVGMDRLVDASLVDLGSWRPRWSAQTSAVRRFVVRNNYLEFTSTHLDLPYPDAHSLASVLQDPYLRRVLPASVREPVRLAPRLVTHGAFVPGGFYPSTPTDAEVPSWGSYAATGNAAVGRFESEPIAPCQLGGSLEFQVAGYLGLPGLSLAVKDLRSGREVEVKPVTLARESWKSARVSCPDGPYAIIAADDRPDYWFAFRPPVEVGRASPAAESLIETSWRLLLLSVAMAVFACRWT